MRFVRFALLVAAVMAGSGEQSSWAQSGRVMGQDSWRADRQQRLGMMPAGSLRQRDAATAAGYLQPGVTEPPQLWEQPGRASRIAVDSGPGRVAQTGTRGSNGYLPQKYRTAQSDQPVEAPAPRQVMPAQLAPTQAPVGPGSAAAPNLAFEGYSDQAEYDYVQPGQMTVGDGYFADPTGCGGCEVGCQDCIGYGRVGGVPPGYIADCWLFGLGRVLREAEYFGGAQAFQTSSFLAPGSTSSVGDCSFGFYTGLNLGLPLRQLTCGLVSGQFGLRTVQSDYSGDLFSSDNRDQLFLTTGFYRRVDYGLQFGVVMDYLRENWFTDIEVIQMRGDLAWVYPTGSAFGFRFTKNVQDWVSSGVLDGTAFSDLRTGTYNQSRFYYRNGCVNGGWADFFLGWTDESHVIGGVEYDIPLTECWAINSGFTYLFPQDNPEATSFAGNSHDAWNVFVGMSWRPMGRNWYRNYDQPLLPVADNGTMVLRRGF